MISASWGADSTTDGTETCLLGIGVTARYRFTVNAFDLLAPAEVTTFTLTSPSRAFNGTLHLMRVLLQETYCVHFVAPNFTQLALLFLPKLLPVIVIVTPRFPNDGKSFVTLGLTGCGGGSVVTV